MLMDSQPSQQHAGLHHGVWLLQQEVTRPKARFKTTLPEKSGVDGGANQVPTVQPPANGLSVVNDDAYLCMVLNSCSCTYLNLVTSSSRPLLELHSLRWNTLRFWWRYLLAISSMLYNRNRYTTLESYCIDCSTTLGRALRCNQTYKCVVFKIDY